MRSVSCRPVKPRERETIHKDTQSKVGRATVCICVRVFRIVFAESRPDYKVPVFQRFPSQRYPMKMLSFYDS